MTMRMRLLVALCLAAACGARARVRVPVKVPRFTASGSLKVTVDAWARISTGSGAIAVTSKGAADIPDLMVEINRAGIPGQVPVDLVYVVDTTGSMGNDIAAAKAQMRNTLADLTSRNPDRRVGIVAYKDRGDPYTAMVVLPLEVDGGKIEAGIDWLRTGGGGDLREHVYAGLDTALQQQPWREGTSRHIVLIGDAPPHEDYLDDQRNFDSVMAEAAALGVKIHTIGVTCDSACQKELAAEEEHYEGR
jgi:Mg-chelatase subunit ChlD